MTFETAWVDFAKMIVKESWEKEEPYDIFNMVTAYSLLRAVASHGPHNWSFRAVTLSGVYYKAMELGLITESEYHDFQKSKKATRKLVTSKKRAEIKKRDGDKCLVCHCTAHLQVDHIRPVFLGGGSDDTNLQTLCKSCHKIKGFHFSDFRHRTKMPKMSKAELDKFIGDAFFKNYIQSVNKLQSLKCWATHNHSFRFEKTHFYVFRAFNKNPWEYD